MTVQLTDSSKSDLKIIEENLSDFNGSGTDFIDQITQRMGRLITSPELGPSLQSKIEVITDYRYLVFPFTKRQIYIIVYRIDGKKEIVYINRVFDGRMNYLNILFGDH
ncbi:MAG: type II toxin-antitoxin system RelE/ParE family toxin [Oscillospiraceae bacterium]|nr:type II toxin-antitoxin system RelE/ParE family toxin [Oscillospiraceae bacterium]